MTLCFWLGIPDGALVNGCKMELIAWRWMGISLFEAHARQILGEMALSNGQGKGVCVEAGLRERESTS